MMEYKNNLPELPKGWVWTTFDNITDGSKNAIVDGPFGTQMKVHEFIDSGIPVIEMQNLQGNKFNPSFRRYITKKKFEEVNRSAIKPQDIIISKTGTLGLTAVVPNEINTAIITSRLAKISLNLSISNLSYIHYFLLYLRKAQWWEKIGKGSTMKVLTISNIANTDIPLPPLSEQHRIVTKIEELFTKLDTGAEVLKKIKTQLKRYRQSVLKSAMEGKLTEKWREEHKHELEPAPVLLERIKEERKKKLGKKYKEQPLANMSELPGLPRDWMWTELRAIAEFKNGINFNKRQKGGKGILTIDVLNMYSKGIFIDLDELYRVNKSVTEEYLLKYGDILFVRSSVKREGVGWASAFKQISEPVTFCGFIIRARLQNQGILPEYVTYFLRTNYARELIIGKGSQVTITNIGQYSIGGIPIPLASTAEQHKIVEEIERRFSVADKVEKIVEQSLKQSERLRQSILKKAFEGKLMPQDPTNEPANVLLERIKKEKEKLDAERKSKRKNRKKKTKKYIQKGLM